MPTVRLSGKIIGSDDPSRTARAELLFHLFNTGWDITNSNGARETTLANIEEKIIESKAFVFTPGATLEEMFEAVSVFVGYQTLDPNLAAKPSVVLNNDHSWDLFFEILDHLNRLGTIKQDYRDYLLTADSAEEVTHKLSTFAEQGLPPIEHHHPLPENTTVPLTNIPAPESLAGNVCVFCSASIKDPAYIQAGITMGRSLAEADLGCVSGAGKTGIMGAVVKGCVDANGWAAGSNVPHIIELEGLPDGLSCFWLRDDIYTRMEVMIENSDAFVIFPGGAGTFQELLALMIFHQQGNPLMKDKPVIIFNREDDQGVKFWQPLVELLQQHCNPAHYTIVEQLEDIVPTIQQAIKKSKS